MRRLRVYATFSAFNRLSKHTSFAVARRRETKQGRQRRRNVSRTAFLEIGSRRDPGAKEDHGYVCVVSVRRAVCRDYVRRDEEEVWLRNDDQIAAAGRIETACDARGNPVVPQLIFE